MTLQVFFGKFVDLISHNIAGQGEFRKYEKVGFFSISSTRCFSILFRFPFLSPGLQDILGESNVELSFKLDSS